MMKMYMLKQWHLAVDFWLSTGQLQHYFRLSVACFGCPMQMDNQNFERWWKFPKMYLLGAQWFHNYLFRVLKKYNIIVFWVAKPTASITCLGV